MAGKFNLKDIGVVYLDELTQQDVPPAEANTGILSWDGAAGELAVTYTANQLSTYATIPTNQSLASSPTGVLAQNIAISGTSVSAQPGTLLGAVYLKAGTLSTSCSAYLQVSDSLSQQREGTIVITDGQTNYVYFVKQILANVGSFTGTVVCLPNFITAIPQDGWYEVRAWVDGQQTGQIDLYGLRLTY